MKIKLETVTFIDSLRKAEAIAPKKGDVSETTYGIILEANAIEGSLVAKATDGIFFYMESIPILSIDGEGQDSTSWRVPSSTFYGAVSKLPKRMGSEVTIEQKDNQIVVLSGKTVIKMRLMADEVFPEFNFYDSSEFVEFTNITGKSNKIKWAVSRVTNDPKSCVMVRGDKMYATNNFVAARITLDKDTGLEVLYPPITLSRVIPFGADVRVSQADNMLVIAPDDYSQLLMATMDSSAFPYDALDRMIESTDLDLKSTASKSEISRMLDGVMPLLSKGSDEGNSVEIYIGKGELAFFYSGEEGTFGDRIDAAGDCVSHERIKLLATHSILRSAIESLGDIVTIEYSRGAKKLRFTDGNYTAIMALRTRK